MNATHGTKGTQTTPWNGFEGCAKAQAQDPLNQTLKPFRDPPVDAVPTDRPARVLDVGRGAAGTTAAAAPKDARDG